MKKIPMIITAVMILSALSSCTLKESHTISVVDESDCTIEAYLLHFQTTDDFVVDTNETTAPFDERTDSGENSGTAESTSLASGGLNTCMIHSPEYHQIAGQLIEYVGYDDFTKWIEYAENKDSETEGCSSYMNIYNFIKDLNIPRDVFELLYYNTHEYYFADHNIELLYCDDIDAVNQYYSSYKEREAQRNKYIALFEIKMKIEKYAQNSKDPTMQMFFETYCQGHYISEWSIADFVRISGMPRADFEKLIEASKVKEYPGKTVILDCFDFNYDLLYDEKSDLMKSNNNIQFKINEDRIFCNQSQLSIDVVPENTVEQ